MSLRKPPATTGDVAWPSSPAPPATLCCAVIRRPPGLRLTLPSLPTALTAPAPHSLLTLERLPPVAPTNDCGPRAKSVGWAPPPPPPPPVEGLACRAPAETQPGETSPPP